MKISLGSHLGPYIVCILLSFSFAACKKEDNANRSPILQEPSAIKITTVSPKGLNAFSVSFEVRADSNFEFDNYGLIIAKDSIRSLSQPGVRLYSIGRFKATLKRDSILIDSLDGNTEYHLKAFIVKGSQTWFSDEQSITTGGLKIKGIEPVRNGFFASRGETVYLKMNFNDSTLGITESKVKIDGIAAAVTIDYNDFILVKIPMNLTAGKKSIEITRSGLTLSIADTLEIVKGKFELLPDFPYTYRSLYGTCQIDNVGYMIGGSKYAMTVGPGTSYNDVLTYNLNSNTWANNNLAPYPAEFIQDFCTFAVNGKIYAMPGRETYANVPGIPTTNRVFEYDPAANKWTQKASFPGSKRLRSSGFVLNDKIYVFGGFGPNALNEEIPFGDLWEYTPATDTWLRKADFTGTTVIFPAIFTYNNKAYIFGGTHPQSLDTKEFWEYDQQHDSWTAIPLNEDISKRFRTTYFTIGSKGYMLGGCYNIMTGLGWDLWELNDNWEIDLITKKWKRISDLPAGNKAMPYNFTPFYLQACAFIKDNTAIIYDKGNMYKFSPEQ
jgi:N-acetylneuraminic acid mutarotase